MTVAISSRHPAAPRPALRTQLGWCRRAGVARMIIAHCGTEIVKHDRLRLRSEIRRMGQERGVRAEIPFDGLEVQLRRG